MKVCDISHPRFDVLSPLSFLPSSFLSFSFLKMTHDSFTYSTAGANVLDKRNISQP